MKPYRPSNGTEGEAFVSHFCLNCERDKDEDCEILARSLAFEINDPRYPKEWIETKDGPGCTAFVERGKPIPPPFNPNQGTLLL